MSIDLARHRRQQRSRLAGLYAFGGAALLLVAMALGGVGLVLLWPALALLYVTILYAFIGTVGFGKREDGRIGLAVQVLLAPYLVAAWVNSRLWTRRHPNPDLVADQVWLGRFPSRRELRDGGFRAVIDLSAELPGFPLDIHWRAIPMMDMVVPPTRTLAAAARTIEQSRRLGPVLVACALGYGRSAAAVATWLMISGRAGDAGEAVAIVRAARPNIVLGPAALVAINIAADRSL